MKIFTLLAISGISLCSTQVIKAQETQSPWTFGVKVGMNASTSDVETYYAPHNTDGIVGFNGGVTVEYALPKGFFLSSGLEFTTKGADNGSSSAYTFYQAGTPIPTSYTYSKESRRWQYLQVPLTIGYRIPISQDVNLTFNAGGYFALAVSGKSTLETWEIPTSGEASVLYNKTKDSKSGDPDYGLLFGTGVEYKRFSFNVNYELGLRDQSTGVPSSYYGTYGTYSKWKNRNVSFSVGYKF